MKKVLNFLIPAVVVLLAVTVVVTGIFFDSIFGKTDWFIEKSQTDDVKLTVKADKNGEVLDGFGASACRWSQIAGNSEYAQDIAKLLYNKEGLGLSIYRYNIGAGSADNSETLIENPWHFCF